MKAYVYLVLTSQAQTRSSIVGNSAPAVEAQEVFKSTFIALINEDYSFGIDIQRYQGVFEHALSKVNFLVGTVIYVTVIQLVGSKQFKLGIIIIHNRWCRGECISF